MKEIEVIKEHKIIELITSYKTKVLTKYPPLTQVTTKVTITGTIIISHTCNHRWELTGNYPFFWIW